MHLCRNQHQGSKGVQVKGKVVDVKVKVVTARINVKGHIEGSHSGSVALGKKKRTWSRVESNPKKLKENVLVSPLSIASLYS